MAVALKRHTLDPLSVKPKCVFLNLPLLKNILALQGQTYTGRFIPTAIHFQTEHSVQNESLRYLALIKNPQTS